VVRFNRYNYELTLLRYREEHKSETTQK